MEQKPKSANRSKTLLFVIGAIALGITALLAVLFTLIGTGIVGASRTTLVFTSQSQEFVYDGTSHTAPEWELTEGELQEGHEAEAVFSGSRLSVGTAENTFTVRIKDANGADVTRYYKIECRPGTITVLGRPVTIRTASAEKVYDGTPLTAEGAQMTSGELLDGHTLSVEATGTRTEAGEGRNTFSAKVTDADGADVTANYAFLEDLGTLKVTPVEISVSSGSAEKVYDGTPLTCDGYTVSSATKLLEGHTVTEVVMPSSQTDAGVTSNTITQLVICDEDGRDVSNNYNVRYFYGTLLVRPMPITVRSGSASKVYDGTPLTCNGEDDWEFTSIYRPIEGHTAQVAISGTRTEVGESDNTIAQVLIYDEAEKDVTSNYEVTLEFGILTVKEGSGQTPGGSGEGEGEGEGEGGSGGGSLDASGNIQGGDPDAEPYPVLRVMTEGTQTVYLRAFSYGDYTGKGWTQAEEYDGLLSGTFSLNYLMGVALAQAGCASSRVGIEVLAGKDYFLPYYTSLSRDGSYDIQTSDVIYSGDVSAAYTLDCFFYDVLQSGIPNAGLGGYIAAEESYRTFVKKQYLSVDGASSQLLAYLDAVIAEQGLKDASKDVIALIAQAAAYIRGAAEYNLDYDRTIDDSADKVYDFLVTYKEGICQHYASAATLLLRRMGLPARYVSGYAAETEAGVWTEVTSDKAHAWVEVYLDGIGWVQIEVTGGGPGGGAGGGTGEGDGGGTGEGEGEGEGEGGTGEGEGEGGSGGGSLDASGNIQGGDPDAEPCLVLRVQSERDAKLYLRAFSFGDYTGTMWTQAEEYDGLLDGTFSLNYLTSAALAQAGYSGARLRIEVLSGGDYFLPYYTSLSRIDDYDIQTSDVKYGGDVSGTDTLYYYTYDVTQDGRPSAGPGGYSAAEEAYRAFVREQYLDLSGVDGRLLDYLDKIIEENGLNDSSKDVSYLIAQAAAYIRGAAEYNLKYDRALDGSADIVYDFLVTYKEGICQHYASAATLLLRRMGLPARYVSGYVAETEANVWTDVMSDKAHAWVEVYLDGIGWVHVEVTGGSASEMPGGGSGAQQTKLTIKPVNEYQHESVGTVLRPSGEVQGLGSLLADGYTYEAVVEGEQTGLGIGTSTITSFTLYDPDRNDVTDKFKIAFLDGKLQIYCAELTVTTGSANGVFDGVPLTCGECSHTGTLLPGHTVSVLRATGEQYLAGSSSNTFEIVILDEQGEDVTDTYKINAQYGTLTVQARQITVTAGSAEKIYDGAPLTCREYELSGELAEGHTVVVTLRGSQTGIGRCENLVESVVIYDRDGNDVTDGYIVVTVNGTLRVDPPVG